MPIKPDLFARPMKILVVSPNILFGEVLAAAAGQFSTGELEVCSPGEALERICAARPDILIVNDTVPSDQLDRLLSVVRNLPRCRVLLVNPQDNEVVVLDSNRATLKRLEDLAQAVQASFTALDTGRNESISTPGACEVARAESKFETDQQRRIQKAPMISIQEDYFDAMAVQAKTRATFSSLLNMHFFNIPDEAFVHQLREPAFKENLKRLAEDESLPADLASGLRLMLNDLDANSSEPDARLAERLGVDRTRLYRGISPTYGPPPPYETVWSGGHARSTEILQEISQLYHDSGLTPSTAVAERLDYIGFELAFIQQLAEEEANAWEAGDEPAAMSRLERQRDFLFEHLVKWAPQFIERAAAEARTDFYRGHLLALRGFLNEQQEFLANLSAFGGIHAE